MITQKQFLEVQDAKARLRKLQEIVESYNSQYVYARVGLIEINRSSPNEARASKLGSYFYNEFRDFCKDLDALMLAHVNREIAALKLTISQHISEG